MSDPKHLIAAHLDDSLTDEERTELHNWLKASPANVQTFVEANVREQRLRAVVKAQGEWRVVRNTKTQARRRPVFAWIAAVAALLVFGMAWLFVDSSKPSDAKLTGNLAGVAVQRKGQTLEATTALRLMAGDIVKSQRGGARIAFVSEATTFALAPHTSIVLQQLNGKKRFTLLSGSIEAEVAKQHNGSMIWQTEDAEAHVIGTKFALSADGLLTRLDVTEGSVEFAGRGASASKLVRAGQLSVSDSQGVSTPRSIQEPRAASDWNVPEQSTPGCRHVSFHSRVIDQDLGVNVLLPPQYENQLVKRFPVLYFLHGLGSDEHTEAARFAPLFLRAMASGEIPPFIAVFPNGGPGYYPRPMQAGQIFTVELTDFIDGTYRTQTWRSARLVCGTGFGGKRALMYGIIEPQVFGNGCGIDDTFLSATCTFFNLIDAMRVRIERHPPRILLLHGQPHSNARADDLVRVVRAKNINIESRLLPALPANSPAYAVAAFAELKSFLTPVWKAQ